MIQCKYCKTYKDFDEFYVSNQSKCVDCMKAYQLARHSNTAKKYTMKKVQLTQAETKEILAADLARHQKHMKALRPSPRQKLVWACCLARSLNPHGDTER